MECVILMEYDVWNCFPVIISKYFVLWPSRMEQYSVTHIAEVSTEFYIHFPLINRIFCLCLGIAQRTTKN